MKMRFKPNTARAGLACAVVAIALGAIIANAEVNVVTPSTNDENKTLGWAHVNEVVVGPGYVDLQFVSTRAFYSCFEYRTDGDTSQVIGVNNYNPGVTDGLYPYYCQNNDSRIERLYANQYVEIRMVFGAETDERFDWTPFFVTEAQCPIIADIQPTLVPVNTSFLLTANVDDSTTGGSTIDSAEYSIDGGTGMAMGSADGAFDEISEAIVATVPALAVGVYTVAVTATDAEGNTCSESIMLAVYDPSAGFVTGGGWINSPAGAYVGPDAWQVKWNQPFNSDTDGWFDANSGWYGTITAQPDGTALVQGDADSAPFSRFDGYHDVWPGTWVAEIDAYLDPTWDLGEGFDYSVAASGSDGAHLRDYIFHVTRDTSTGELLVAGSNNTNFAPREDLENINHYNVVTAGWYTLQHVFTDAGGYLAVDLNLLDSDGNVLFTETRSNAADTIPGEVGGNRYAWFTVVAVSGGIAVDNHQRLEYGPTYPTGKASFGFVSKYQKGASVPTGSTEFVFQAAGLNFHSTSYQWLVVDKASARAQYKGEGLINGMGPYKFMLWAGDGAPSGTPDTFRIRMWSEHADNIELVIYDNETDQEIGGGNIMVHVPKK